MKTENVKKLKKTTKALYAFNDQNDASHTDTGTTQTGGTDTTNTTITMTTSTHRNLAAAV